MNPKAQFQNEISIDTVLNSVMVADPLHVFDCSPITDGASAVVIALLILQKNIQILQFYVKASAQASGTLSLHDRPDITTIDATTAAANWAIKWQSYHQDIQFAEVHDCFTIAEICAIEDLGFVKKGGRKSDYRWPDSNRWKDPINPSAVLKHADILLARQV